MPASKKHIEDDPELNMVYLPLHENKSELFKLSEYEFNKIKESASEMEDIISKMVIKPNKIRKWKECLKHDYHISESELNEYRY